MKKEKPLCSCDDICCIASIAILSMFIFLIGVCAIEQMSEKRDELTISTPTQNLYLNLPEEYEPMQTGDKLVAKRTIKDGKVIIELAYDR